jgi:FkbM family methyltransferase
MLKTYSGWFGNFSLDPEIDFYGNSFWEAVSKKTYEPDTMVFLENNLSPSTDFIDVGAATGAMSLIAAKLGSRVLLIEAVPWIFNVAKLHIEGNPEIAQLVTLKNCAVSSHEGILKMGSKADPAILSSIANKELIKRTENSVKIVTLANEIETFHDLQHKLIIKIDIEGAEWRLLSHIDTLETLGRHSARVLLAIHPGFDRPFTILPLGMTWLTKKYWQIKNAVIVYKFFKRVIKYAKVYRTSLDNVKSPKKCVLLMFGGYFEFILDFGWDK